METAYITNAAGHSLEVELETVADDLKRIEIDINDWYGVAEYTVMGYDFNDYIPSFINEMTDEQLRTAAIEVAKKIDEHINEDFIGEEWENYHEQIEEAFEHEDFNVEIVFTGRYELSEKEIWNDSSWVIENWKEEAGIED